MRKAGGDVILSQTWTRIQDKASQARTLLNNAISLMDEEEVNDDSLRSQYGSRWDRTSSKELTTSLRTSGGNYLDKLDRAITSDKLVEERLKISIPSIMQLNCEQVSRTTRFINHLNSYVVLSLKDGFRICHP